ncbi:Transcriptional activator NphR [compost metagenome]
MPPHQWQMKARIDRVKQQLAETDLPLTSVAAETGFADAAHFSRVFRQQVGVSPSAWRRANGG